MPGFAAFVTQVKMLPMSSLGDIPPGPRLSGLIAPDTSAA